ncbi:F-box protein at3g07870 [Phtheirospermum japonicum]|uniref:F-box protein at3g07870 n=1 Tax=Phtheirospermum japonicum TaxID=374723 RepID=A0A830B2I5_9LAMI|nr:F-box protein at3g07870 [Phtheirospermum japonicum]
MENKMMLMNLPTNVIVEILARLPAKTIIQCKTVCKTWLQLITHPHFTSLHFSLARPGLIVHHSEMFKNFFKLVDFEDSYDRHDLPHETMAKFNFANLSTLPDANIVVDGSVNGLLFLRDINYKHETLYICNPLTREYFQLPRPDGLVRYPMVVTYGFGLTRKTGEYKIVRILHQCELNPRNGHCVGVPFSECQVYSFATRAWRNVIRGAPARFAYDSRMIGLFFQGNVHWLIQDLEGFELISCFDLENEVFRPFPGPFPGRRVLASLGVLKGRLSLCDNTDHQNVDIWAMREYGVEKTWAKEIVIRKMPELVGPSFQIVYALKVFEDGNVLILWGDFFMFYYCGKSRVAEEVDIDQPRGPNSIEAIHHVPSFLSLKNFVTKNVCTF